LEAKKKLDWNGADDGKDPKSRRFDRLKEVIL
jgi:hypothetical protein